jgi:hypothetical protein
MDAREMKKHILLRALENYETKIQVRNELTNELRIITDNDNVTSAQIGRLKSVLMQMILNAESKI